MDNILHLQMEPSMMCSHRAQLLGQRRWIRTCVAAHPKHTAFISMCQHKPAPQAPAPCDATAGLTQVPNLKHISVFGRAGSIFNPALGSVVLLCSISGYFTSLPNLVFFFFFQGFMFQIKKIFLKRPRGLGISLLNKN